MRDDIANHVNVKDIRMQYACTAGLYLLPRVFVYALDVTMHRAKRQLV